MASLSAPVRNPERYSAIKENEIDKAKERDSNQNELSEEGPIIIWLGATQGSSPAGEEMGEGVGIIGSNGKPQQETRRAKASGSHSGCASSA
jgi:hypothetical protein